MGLNRGEVWWLEHPDAGRRPACVMSRQAAIPVLTSVLVVPATTKIRGIPTEVRIGPDDGMPQECVLSVDNFSNVRKALLVDRITALSSDKLSEVCAALRVATGCRPGL